MKQIDLQKEAISDLQRFYRLKRALRYLIKEWVDLSNPNADITSPVLSDICVQSNRLAGDTIGDIIVKRERQQNLIEIQIEETVRILKYTLFALMRISSEDRWILKSCYMLDDVSTLDDIKQRFSISTSAAYRMRVKALEHYLVARYGAIN